MRPVSVRSKSTKRKVHHSGVNHGITGFDQQLVIATETAVATQPGKRAFNELSIGQELEAFDSRVTFNDFDLNARPYVHVSNEICTPINTVSPALLEAPGPGREE